MSTLALKAILKNYESDNPGTKTNLYRILNHGRLAGTGRMIILPVDQGFEHGPGRSFAMNEEAYDPHYHYSLAVEGGVNAFAAPLGLLEAGADTYAGQVPLILKINSSNSLVPTLNQAVTGCIADALRLGCVGIGFTIYPGSDDSLEMMEEVRELAKEAKSKGLVVVIWSYARGHMTQAGETALDTISYGAHMAALLGAHIIKVKLPTDHLENKDAKSVYEKYQVRRQTLTERVRHVVQCCFNGRRLVIFSGGATKAVDRVYDEAQAIIAGGGAGSIMGRNCFQRPKNEALDLLSGLVKIYKG